MHILCTIVTHGPFCPSLKYVTIQNIQLYTKHHACSEQQAMLEFHNIINSGCFQLLLHTGPHYGCRVSRQNDPVIHDHSYINKGCPPYIKTT